MQAGGGINVLNCTKITMDSLQLNNIGTGVIVTANTPGANISLVRSEVGFTNLGSTMWEGGKYSLVSH